MSFGLIIKLESLVERETHDFLIDRRGTVSEFFSSGGTRKDACGLN